MKTTVAIAAAMPMLLIGVLGGMVLGRGEFQAGKVALLTGTSISSGDTDISQWSSILTAREEEFKKLNEKLRGLKNKQAEAKALKTSFKAAEPQLQEVMESLVALQQDLEKAGKTEDILRWLTDAEDFETSVTKLDRAIDEATFRKIEDMAEKMEAAADQLKDAYEKKADYPARVAALRRVRGVISESKELEKLAKEELDSKKAGFEERQELLRKELPNP